MNDKYLCSIIANDIYGEPVRYIMTERVMKLLLLYEIKNGGYLNDRRNE